MSDASKRGKTFEQDVAGLIRHKLKIAVQRDKRSGAGINKADISDYWNELPLHIECKNQETVKIKEWFQQADDAASFSKAPTVVFAKDEEVLATLRFTDLLDFLVEIADLRAEVEDLRTPIIGWTPPKAESLVDIPVEKIVKAVNEKQVARFCRAGHIADDYGYCLQPGCKYARGYKAKKGKANV